MTDICKALSIRRTTGSPMARGGLYETNSVSKLNPLWATQYTRTPTPGAAAPPTSSADRILLQPAAVVLGQGECASEQMSRTNSSGSRRESRGLRTF